MNNLLNKIFVSLFIISVLCSQAIAQDTTITIKYDTVKIQKTRIIKIATVLTVPKFILHVSGGLNTGAMRAYLPQRRLQQG